MNHLRIPGIALLLMGCCTAGKAAIVDLTPQAVGQYVRFGNSEIHDSSGTRVANTLGFIASSYMVFDISTIGAPVIALDLAANSGSQSGRFTDVNVEFNAFSGNISALTTGGLVVSDLENSRDYASFFAPGTLPDFTDFTVGLNADALTDINAAVGTFVITATQPVVATSSGFMGDLPANQITLTVTTVPEPTSMLVLVAFACGAVIISRRRKRSTTNA